MIAQIFNPTAELTITIAIPINEVNAETETQPLKKNVFFMFFLSSKT